MDGKRDRICISAKALEEAITRDNALREERIQRARIKARERENRLMRELEPGPRLRCRQRWNETASFRHCCDRFYAQIDYDIRMWDREQALKLGVRQVVEEVERERRRRRQMRALIRDDLIRRGLV